MKVEFERSRRRAWIALALSVPVLLLGVDRIITDGDIVGSIVDTVRAPSELEEDLSRPPEVNEDGAITNQGRSEQRADWVWGWALIAAGGALAIWSIGDLGRRRRALVADDNGLFLDVGSAANDVFVPWYQVESIRSTIAEGDTGPTRSIEITISGATWVPADPVHATWDGSRLLIDADDWRVPAHEAAGVLEVMLERSRQMGRDVGPMDRGGEA